MIGFNGVYTSQAEYSDSESDGEELHYADAAPCAEGTPAAQQEADSARMEPTKRTQLRFKFGWRLHVGCWPGSSCSSCDKAYNGMEYVWRGGL